MTFVTDEFIRDMLADAESNLVIDPDKAIDQSSKAIELVETNQLVSEAPLVIVDRAYAMRERAELAKMFSRANVDEQKGLSDIESLFLENRIK